MAHGLRHAAYPRHLWGCRPRDLDHRVWRAGWALQDPQRGLRPEDWSQAGGHTAAGEGRLGPDKEQQQTLLLVRPC